MTSVTHAPTNHSTDLAGGTPASGPQLRPPPTPSPRESSAPPEFARSKAVALIALRLALGFEFLWAFLDKTFGFGYSTPSAKAWIHGGSPTKGFLSNVASGPLQSTFHSIAGAQWANWLFMAGLLGIGVAFMLGVAIRPAAVCGVLLLALMWFATWPLAKFAGGQPTGSVNPFVDEHVISALGMIVVAVFVATSSGYLGRIWAKLTPVADRTWLR